MRLRKRQPPARKRFEQDDRVCGAVNKRLIALLITINGEKKMKYLYPKNLKSKANLWLWGMKDFAVLCVAALVSALALAGLKIYLPAVITLCYGFLTIRKDDATVLYYIRYAARYFITEQQTYKWEK